MCQDIKSTQKWQRKVEGSETGGEDKNSSNHAFPECIENFEKYVPFTQKFTERVVMYKIFLNIFIAKINWKQIELLTIGNQLNKLIMSHPEKKQCTCQKNYVPGKYLIVMK